jgi:hypothetical protein
MKEKYDTFRGTCSLDVARINDDIVSVHDVGVGMQVVEEIS